VVEIHSFQGRGCDLVNGGIDESGGAEGGEYGCGCGVENKSIIHMRMLVTTSEPKLVTMPKAVEEDDGSFTSPSLSLQGVDVAVQISASPVSAVTAKASEEDGIRALNLSGEFL